MRTPSGILHVVDFKTDQIISAIQPKNYWADNRHWEIKSNIDMLEFKTFDGTPHAVTLQQQNLVLKEVRDGRIVPYVINNEVEKDSDDRSLTVHASGAWVQIAKDGIIKPQRIESETVNTFIDIALADSKWQRGITDYSSFHTMTIDEFIDPLTFLKKIAALFELEIRYRVEVSGSQITGWYVDMIKKRGRETGKEVTLGKDIVGIRRIEHSRDICTALVGFVRGEGDKLITIESINNGHLYITDSDAFQRWNAHGKHKFGFYTPETEDQNMTPQRLMTLMKTELKKRVNSSVSYEVEAQSIGRIFGLAHELINEGDTIRIKDTGFTPKLYLEARVIAGDESFTDPTQDKYVFGDYREITDPNEELRKIYNRILGSLGNKQELIDQLDKLVKDANETASNAKKESEAAKTLAEKVQENLKNNTVNIIESKQPPTENLQIGNTIWRDISTGKPGILKVWNGKDWELLIPDPETIKKETMEQVNKDIQLTKEELNKKVEEAQNETAGQFKEVTENLQEVSLTIKNVQNSQGEIDKTVSEMKQTNEGFTKSIDSLTKKNGEITEKLNTVVETSEGTIKKISEVQQTTNDLKKTTTEIEEKAGEISEKLTSVEKKVDNTEFGIRNLLLETAIKSHSVKTGENKPHTYFVVAKDAVTLMQGKNIAMSFLFTGKVTEWGTTNKWVGFEVKITFIDNTFAYPSCRIENHLTLGKQYKQERFTASAVVMDKPIKEILVYALGRDFTGDVLIEKPKLEVGTVPTAWTPAPEDQVTNEEFTKKTTEIEKSVNGIKESIKTVEKTQVDFSQRVTTVEKTADGIKENVTSLQEIQTKQGTQLQEAKAGWETTAKALEGKVEIKDVEDYVGGIGNQPVLRNVLWKNDTKYWILQSGTTRDTTVLYKGCNTLRTISTGNTADVYRGASHEVINAGPGWNYVFSAYFYTDNKSSIDNGAKMELKCLDANGNVLKQYGQEITLTQGMWVRHHVFGLLVEGTKKVQVQYWLRRNGRLWVAQPMLQIGDKPSSFMENPVDVVDKDKIMEELADKIATKDYDKKVTELERSIATNEEGVTIISKKQESFINETYNAYVKKTESKLQVLDEGILAQILKDGIITSINMSPGKITIDAEKLNINADTMVKWLTAKGIDTNLIRIDGDKITIDKDGVTVKMLDFLFQDEWGTKTTAVSRRNLIADPDFSSVIKKNIGHNDYYGFEGGYGLTWKSWGNVVIEKNTHIFDYEQMVNAARVDMYNYPEAIVNNGIHPGNEYTASAHFRTAMINGVRKTGKPRIHVCCVKFRDNVSYEILSEQKMDFPEPSTFYGEIRRYSFTFKVPTNYIPQQHALIIKVCSGNADMRQGTAICVSGVTLYSGKYASMYNWDRAAAERADGIQPFNALALGGVNNNIAPAADGQTFDISTEKEVKIFRNIRAMQGINLGGGGFQQWGHIRFTDGNAGAGFYVSTPSGWKFNALG
ncbi:phage tail spike protein [Bacillus cereus]|uniref:phage tail spike protein n=1 Tax=Bacillus cereus TaxID=1396 RepID=UPI00240D877A|nr:phage tail spike protein [Bacillus cereus]MDG1570470.1 phage tail spike protein [Bacillus cereus]